MTLPRPLRARELKAQVNFVEIVTRFTALRRVGAQYVGCCPLHSERHPSFYVHPKKKIFYCFGCKAGGDVFSFIMQISACDFRQALETVAELTERVARASDPRSGARFGASEGAKPMSPPKAGGRYSQSLQDSRAQILAKLEATNRRLKVIAATNQAASAALATACEPARGEFPFIYQKPDNRHE
jgi:CHC2 zinc finger